MKVLIVVLSSFLICSHSYAKTSFGRLFFTPTQRAALDNARKQNSKLELQNETTPTPASISLDGVVKRSDGYSALWINKKLVDPSNIPNNIKINGDNKRGGIRVETGQKGEVIELGVGQKIDSDTGHVQEGHR